MREFCESGQYDTAGLLALVTEERELCQGQVASLQKEWPHVKSFASLGSHLCMRNIKGQS